MAEPLPRNVDFKTIREGWNKYTCEDGVIIRNKISLRRVTLVSKDKQGGQYSYDFSIETESDLPPRIDPNLTLQSGTATLTQKPVLVTPADLERKVRFTPTERITQLYELEDGTILRISEKANEIWKTKKVDQLGRTVYSVNVNVAINGFAPPPT